MSNNSNFNLGQYVRDVFDLNKDGKVTLKEYFATLIPNYSVLVILGIQLSGCQGRPTLEVTATAVPTTLPTEIESTATAMIVQITGDVYVQDDQGEVIGLLYKEDQVQADCSDDWCTILGSNYRLSFLAWLLIR